ncbi:hypothetical protein PVAG01_04958 [Phlyctema vagabunda]|uniref:Uncharacterized protein n=1 Tax=Phlyctema vagabunda TaxID=108571 RepID=A0ABR4PIQ2_9HELO
MADETLLDKIHDLSDLELAALICLVAQEHCIIDTDPSVLDDLVQELELVAAKAFGLTHAVIDCSEHTTLDDFANAIINVDDGSSRSSSPIRTRQDYFMHSPAFKSAHSTAPEVNLDNKRMANVLIAKNLDEAPRQVQIQALELIRTKRIFTRTSVQLAPKRFLFIALLAGGEGPRLIKHLNDRIFISHFHDPENGFANLEDVYGKDDADSISSVVKRTPSHEPEDLSDPRITESDVAQLTKLSNEAKVSVEVKQYQMNIISFLRLHRAVSHGISAIGTQHFDALTK